MNQIYLLKKNHFVNWATLCTPQKVRRHENYKSKKMNNQPLVAKYIDMKMGSSMTLCVKTN
jgi:hypothetical protein